MRNRILFLFLIRQSLFDQIVSIPYLPIIRQKEQSSISIRYSVSDRIQSTSYLNRIWNNEQCNICVPIPYFIKFMSRQNGSCADCMYLREAAVFILIIYNQITRQLATLREPQLLPYCECNSHRFYSLFAQKKIQIIEFYFFSYSIFNRIYSMTYFNRIWNKE